jgi:glycosyltransferase involved in cell wall biosynthesis
MARNKETSRPRGSRKEEPLLTVVVPIYNEADSLAAFLPRLIPYCRTRNWNLILVNDGSRDGSGAILARSEKPPRVQIVQHKLNRGYGGALKSGIAAARTPWVVTIDGDGQHRMEDIDRLLAYALEQDADLVVGRRSRHPGANWYRELGKWLIRRFTEILMPLPIHDLNSGFKLYRAERARRYLPLCPDSMAFSDVITLIFIHQGGLVLEYPVSVEPRAQGMSTISTLTAVETAVEILNLAMMFNPLRIFLPLSAICLTFGLIWGTWIVLLGRGVSVGAMLAIVTGLLFFAIGLIANQLAAIRIGMQDKS